ncbi:unnamed protein product [Kluyveromyces dobzhanskii CBS 2104]|uniref:WGS project CCBQ000000000 data, contig 00028 n=1 Tax=Kluyveromyces dobzhanskii CBS 2104 TaxID=1427455 RepID=A0A0A8L0R4_9SACH|nr:unnamed protein product [Kluyveromyces dobzhanskii CBS 2104]
MSFWPFGQNFNSSNINGILEEYFHVMHGLENQSKRKAESKSNNSSVAGTVGAATDTGAPVAVTDDTDLNETKTTTTYNNDTKRINDTREKKEHARKKKRQGFGVDSEDTERDNDVIIGNADSNASLESVLDSKSPDFFRSSSTGSSRNVGDDAAHNLQPSLIPTPRRFNGSSGGIEPTSLNSAASFHPESLCTTTASSSSASNLSDEDGPISLQSLSHKFMDDILEETELLNELTRQNNTLLDFVCFGYFYTETGDKVENIAYLIDQLLDCIDRIDEDNDFDNLDIVDRDDNGNDLDDDDSINEEHDDKEADSYGNDKNNNDSVFQLKKNLTTATRGTGGISNTIDNEDDDEDNDTDIFGNAKDSFKDAHGFSSLTHDDSILPMLDNKLKKKSTFLNKATVISEIFALDIWLISESLVKNVEYLNKIWSILYHPKFTQEKSPLIPIFLKINQNLLLTRQDQYLNFIRTRENLVTDMLEHIDISLQMDFFLKIIATDKQEAPTGIIELVSEQKLIDNLFAFLVNEKYSADIQACAGDFIKSIIAVSANAPLDEMSIGPNALTREIASEKCIEYLINCIVNERGPALMTAVSVTIELIRKNNSDYDQVNLLTTSIKSHPPSMRDPVYLGTMLKKFSENLVNLKQILFDVANDDKIPVIQNQMGESYKPLGFERFKVVELIAELLHCSNMGLMNSKKAERIVKERDQVRTELVQQLEDALTDLNIKSKLNPDSQNSDSPTELNLDDDVDESFEVPYVNDSQNEKLRSTPTIGDLFKIKLYNCQLLPIIIQLFIKYPWNNFWHNVIFDIIQQIFNGRMDFSYNSFLVYALFSNKNANRFATDQSLDGDIIDFEITRDLVLLGYKNSHKFYEKHNTTLGFMGHLVLIAEEIVKFSKVYKVDLISPDIHEVLLDEDWEFYSNDILNDTRVMYSKILGGGDYIEEGNINGSDIVMGSDQDPTTFSTQMDLHAKLKEKLIEKSRQEVDDKNEKNGVIILPVGPE